MHNSLLHLLLKNGDFLNTDISQGSVATHLGRGGVFLYDFVTNFLFSLTVQEFWKSVNIWWSYGQELGVLFFWLTVYVHVLPVADWLWRQCNRNQKRNETQAHATCTEIAKFRHVFWDMRAVRTPTHMHTDTLMQCIGKRASQKSSSWKVDTALSVVLADRRLWLCCRSWIRRRRYDGVDVLRTVNVS